MRFFDRQHEIESLRESRERSNSVAQFTVVTGRRRVGKTSLVLKAYENEKILYFFVGRKAEPELCESFCSEIEQKLNIPMGNVTSFADIFEFLLKLSVNQNITLFIDEFQEFYRVNKSIFSDIQRLWDLYHDKSHINFLACGSIYSMMSKIFKSQKEPLYGRQTQFLNIRPFSPSTLKEIIAEYNPKYSNEDLLALYTFTGGVAKYVQLLIDADATTKKKMLDYIIKLDSVFIAEGKMILIEEFGKDYGNYFSILSAIARGKNTRNEMESIIGREIGGYLTKLETDYEIIGKKQPFGEKTSSKNVRYFIKDNFFMFWFRFIFKYNYILEIDGYEQVRSIIDRDYETFTGLTLERYFNSVLMESHKYTRIGGWWSRNGENEIDIIAENEIYKTATIFEVKRHEKNIDYSILRAKSDVFLKSTGELKDYTIEYKGLSLNEM